ncbi:MAG: response regulator [Candidatus Eisenbacteria sp.]|nr:response regulator [Candidatus Eisenbacteria bacterium]
MGDQKGMKIQVYCPEQKAFITPLEIGICPYYQAEPLDFRSAEDVVQQLFRCHVQCGCQIQYRYYEGDQLVTKSLDIVGDESRLRSIIASVLGLEPGQSEDTDKGTASGAGPILLVDDDVDFVEINSAVLENAGRRVVKAYSAKECLEKIPKVKPSLVILDVMMEQFDSGFQIASKIKEMTGGVPVILLTSIGAETGLAFKPLDNAGLKKMGADAFLDKPVKAEDLARKVAELLGNE